MINFDGKVAIVTGAASPNGIGFATALLLSRHGASVVLTDLDGGAVDARAGELPGQASGLAHDVTEEASWREVVAETVRRYGRLDILVNNAGVARPSPIDNLEKDQWDEVMSINLTGPYLGCRAVLPAMRKGGGGNIVNISSIAGMVGMPGCAAYSSSKGGVRLLTKTLAIELAADKIRVNSVHPGVIDTDMQNDGKKFVPELLQAQIESIPLKRMGSAADIASMAVFLASDAAMYVTGGEFVVDGGLTAQ